VRLSPFNTAGNVPETNPTDYITLFTRIAELERKVERNNAEIRVKRVRDVNVNADVNAARLTRILRKAVVPNSDNNDRRRNLRPNDVTKLPITYSFLTRINWLKELKDIFEGSLRIFKTDRKRIIYAFRYYDTAIR
jgi:hypothetical protein